MTRLASWLTAVAFACPLAAQLPPGSATAVPNSLQIPWTATNGTGTVRRVEILFWGSNDHQAAIGFRGPGLGLAPAPAVTPYMRNLDLGYSVLDGVRLEGAGLPGTPPAKPRDALLVSVLGTGDELRVAWTDANGATCTVGIDEPAWFRASALQSMALPNCILVAGRSQNGQILLRATYVQGVFTALPSIDLGEPITDVCCLDFDGDGDGEVAALTATGLEVFAADGTVVHSSALAHPGGAIAPLREPGACGLVQLRCNAAGNGWELVRIMGPTADAPVAVTFGNDSFGGLSTGDFDGDGYADAALQDNAEQVRLVRNDPVTPFAAGSVQMAVGPAGSVQQPGAMGDLDYDGIFDLLVPVLLPNGQWVLSLVVGIRSQFGPGETYGEIFTESFHELIDPLSTNVDWFKLGILWEELSAFDTMKVTYYSGDQDEIAAGAYAEEFASATYSLPLEEDEMAGIHIPVPIIKQPNLLFVKVQFSGAGNPDVRPIFLAGATIDDLGEEEELTCAYLEANKPQGAEKKPVTREFPGRKYLGLIIRQTSLPASSN